MQSLLRRLVVPALALAAMAFVPATGRADLVFSTSPGTLQPGENVLFDAFPDQSGTSVLGTTNQTNTTVLFTQPFEQVTLVTPSRGQARVAASSGNFTSLQTQLQNTSLGFTRFEANPNLATGGERVTVRVIETNNQQTDFFFDAKASGQNFFSVEAILGQQIRSVAIFTPSGGLMTVQDVAQIRISGIGVTAVPEASSLALMGIVVGAGAAGGYFRKGRKGVA